MVKNLYKALEKLEVEIKIAPIKMTFTDLIATIPTAGPVERELVVNELLYDNGIGQPIIPRS